MIITLKTVLLILVLCVIVWVSCFQNPRILEAYGWRFRQHSQRQCGVYEGDVAYDGYCKAHAYPDVRCRSGCSTTLPGLGNTCCKSSCCTSKSPEWDTRIYRRAPGYRVTHQIHREPPRGGHRGSGHRRGRHG
jgi:hypothetical protein